MTQEEEEECTTLRNGGAHYFTIAFRALLRVVRKGLTLKGETLSAASVENQISDQIHTVVVAPVHT